MIQRRAQPTAALVALAVLALAGCITRHAPPPPSRTRISGTVTVPADLVDSFLIVQTKGDRGVPFHFLIDTGSSVTLAAPAFAQRHALPGSEGVPRRVQITSVDGRSLLLPAVTLSEIDLGGAHFSSVPAVVEDTATLSADLGVPIDAILGFPFFHDTVVTLDYPQRRLLLRPAGAADALAPSPLPFDDGDKTPVLSLQLGPDVFRARLDSGLDEPLALNPAGLKLQFEYGPVSGQTPYTVAGRGAQQIGRLSETLYVGPYPVPRPVTELTSGTSAIGGGLLKHFTVTLDPRRRLVSFLRTSPDPIALPGERTAGIRFDRTPAYWRVASVVPGSPAAAAGVEAGDLVTRIDGEPVARWDLDRFAELESNAREIAFTFLQGTRETEKRLRVVDLVP